MKQIYRRILATKAHWFGLVLLLLILSIAAHIWLAGIKRPVPPAIGNTINSPSVWSYNKVERIRVSTYNIHRGKGVDRIFDLSRTAKVLKGADIIGINEVAGPTIFGKPNQAQILASKLDLGWLYAPNQIRWFRDYFGNGLLSRFPVSHWVSEPLIYDQDESHSLRNIVTAEIQVNGSNIAVLITHLDLGVIRSTQLARVIERFNRYGCAILMGDMNTGAQDTQINALVAQDGVYDAIKMALGDQTPRLRVDWIFTRGFDVIDGGMTGVGISDHPYFWVDLKLASPICVKNDASPLNGVFIPD